MDGLEAKPLNKEEIRAGKPSRTAFGDAPRLPVSLVLDNLKCAHNVGTLFRLADSLMLERMVLCGTTIAPPPTANSGRRRGVLGALDA